MNIQTLGISICALDGASSIFGKISSSAHRLQGTIHRLGQEGKRFGAIKELSSQAGNWALGAGAAAAGALGFRRVIQEGQDAEHQLYAIGNIAEWSGERLGQVRRELLDHSVATNQSLGALASGLGDLLAKGMDESKALKLIPTIGKAATAAQADVADLSSALFSVVDVAGVPVDKAAKSLEGLLVSGKKGAFELKDMAKSLPSILASSSMLGMKGSKGVAQVGAWLQVARTGAGTSEEAATNFQNFLMKLMSPETEQKFAKLGANLKTEMARAVASGDLVGTMVRRSAEISKGDIGKLFQDQQVIKFLGAAIPKQGMARDITAASLGARGVIDKDYANMMKTWNEQQKKFANLVTRDLLPRLGPWLSRLNASLTWLTANPKVLSAAITGVIALIGGGLALKFMSFALGPAVTFGKGLWNIGRLGVSTGKDLAYCLKNATSLREGFKIFAQLKLPAWMNADAGSVFSKMGTGMKAFSIATWGSVKAIWAQTVALLANPITWIVVGVVALVAGLVLLWKNWGKVTGFIKNTWSKTPNWVKGIVAILLMPILPILWAGKLLITHWKSITAFFGRGWNWLKGLFAKTPDWVKFFIPFIGVPLLIVKHWSKIKSFFSAILGWIKGFAGKCFDAGKNIISSIWKGMLAVASGPAKAIEKILTKVRRFLPFSPAKEGPLSDIHKVGAGLLGTITAGLKPEGLLAKVGGIAGRMRQAFAGGLAPGGVVRALAGAGAAAGMSVTFQISVPAGTPAQQVADFECQLDAAMPRIQAKLAQLQDRQQRGAFK